MLRISAHPGGGKPLPYVKKENKLTPMGEAESLSLHPDWVDLETEWF